LSTTPSLIRVEAAFIRSAASADDFPRDGLPEIALVGRSNVGKSSLINALVRRQIARTSGAPGKTRLANIYRIERSSPLYLVDLPGYGYARGRESAGEFAALTRAYFGQVRQVLPSALLLVDARHPGLDKDLDAWRWLRDTVAASAIVATKIDKLARGERIRALRSAESVFEVSVLPFSAVTGEGLDELWTLIDSQVNSRKPAARSRPGNPRKAMEPHRPKKP
jgi:GTP-binding protein